MTFDQFVQSDATLVRRAWVREPGLLLYVRRPFTGIHTADFELANLVAEHPGNGSLTAFIERYKAMHTFYIENIVEKRLVLFFKRHGFRIITTPYNDVDTSMLSSQCRHIRESTRVDEPLPCRSR